MNLTPKYILSNGYVNGSNFIANGPISIKTTNLDNLPKLYNLVNSNPDRKVIQDVSFFISKDYLEKTQDNLLNKAFEQAKQKADLAAATLGSRMSLE